MASFGWGYTNPNVYAQSAEEQTLWAMTSVASGGPTSGGGATSQPFTSKITPPAQLPQNFQQGDFDPWSKYRSGMGDKLATMAESDPSNFYRDRLQQMSTQGGNFTPDDPSYKWRLEQGQQATERSLAARGLLNSGNAAIELQAYGQGMASQEYGAQFDRMLKGLSGVSQQYDTQMQRLMAMAGVGLDPTAAAKVNIESMKANTGLYNAALDAETSRYTAELNASTQAANAQLNADTSMNTARIGSYSGDLRAMQGMAEFNYGVEQQQAYQDAINSALFFNRPGGVLAGYGGAQWQIETQVMEQDNQKL